MIHLAAVSSRNDSPAPASPDYTPSPCTPTHIGSPPGPPAGAASPPAPPPPATLSTTRTTSSAPVLLDNPLSRAIIRTSVLYTEMPHGQIWVCHTRGFIKRTQSASIQNGPIEPNQASVPVHDTDLDERTHQHRPCPTPASHPSTAHPKRRRTKPIALHLLYRHARKRHDRTHARILDGACSCSFHDLSAYGQAGPHAVVEPLFHPNRRTGANARVHTAGSRPRGGIGQPDRLGNRPGCARSSVVSVSAVPP